MQVWSLFAALAVPIEQIVHTSPVDPSFERYPALHVHCVDDVDPAGDVALLEQAAHAEAPR